MNADNRPAESMTGVYRRYLVALTLFHQVAADEAGLPPTDYRASNVLDLEGPITSGELARRVGLSTGATTRLVDRLVAAGIARRVTDPADRRRALVEHTGELPPGLWDRISAARTPIGDALNALTDEQRSGVEAYLVAAERAYRAAAER